MTAIQAFRAARAHGITPALLQTLLVVIDDYPATCGRIAKACGVSGSAITGTVDTLEKTGWLERREKPNDRRGKHVFPTDHALWIFSPHHLRETP